MVAMTEHSGSPVDPLSERECCRPRAAALALWLVMNLIAGCTEEKSSADVGTSDVVSIVTSSRHASTPFRRASALQLDTATPIVPVATEAPTTTAPPPDDHSALVDGDVRRDRGRLPLRHDRDRRTTSSPVSAEGDRGRRRDPCQRHHRWVNGLVCHHAGGHVGLLRRKLGRARSAGARGRPGGRPAQPRPAVVVTSYGNGPTVLTGTYPASALSLAGDDPSTSPSRSTARRCVRSPMPRRRTARSRPCGPTSARWSTPRPSRLPTL